MMTRIRRYYSKTLSHVITLIICTPECCIQLVGRYVPNNGTKEDESMVRRKVWDGELMKYLAYKQKESPDYRVVLVGDLNVANDEVDVTAPVSFFEGTEKLFTLRLVLFGWSLITCFVALFTLHHRS